MCLPDDHFRRCATRTCSAAEYKQALSKCPTRLMLENADAIVRLRGANDPRVAMALSDVTPALRAQCAVEASRPSPMDDRRHANDYCRFCTEAHRLRDQYLLAHSQTNTPETFRTIYGIPRANDNASLLQPERAAERHYLSHATNQTDATRYPRAF